MWGRRRLERAQQAARRWEFVAAVGGMDVLVRSLEQQLEDRFSDLDMSPKLVRPTAGGIADALATWWSEAGDETVNRTPSAFVAEQIDAFVESAREAPYTGVLLWSMRRRKRSRVP